MKAYSNDLRAKVIAAYERGSITQVEIARLFGLSESTVRNFLRRKRLHGSCQALPHAGGQKLRASDQAQSFLIAELQRRNDITLPELRDVLRQQCGLCVSLPTLCRLLKRLGFTRKKNSLGKRASYCRASAATPGVPPAGLGTGL